jgi:hypothetical protein
LAPHWTEERGRILGWAALNLREDFIGSWETRAGRRMVSSGLLRRVALVRTDVSEKPGASFIRVTRIGELGTTIAVTSNRSMCFGC